jgi:hypothetical protein
MDLRRVCVLAGVVMAGLIGDAHAGDENAPFLAWGAVIGVGLHDDENSPVVGAEVSAGWLRWLASSGGSKGPDTFHLPTPFWIGGYGDVLYDAGSDTGRVSFGPEIGVLIFGADGGVVRELTGDKRWGAAIRGSITIPLSAVTTVSLYSRTVKWNGESDKDVELGLIVKYVVSKVR